jgi:LCP family protein required for cell wall assembly
LWRIVRWTAAVVALMVAVALIGGYLAFRHLDGNITALTPDLGTNRPSRVSVPGESQPLNIVLIGTDTREGQTSITGTDGGDLADTTVLLHISADRQRAYGVGIPRDLIVHRPDCPAKSGDRLVPGNPAAMFNTAYGVGHEGCAIRTIEAMTNIRIDHFMVTTFDGFRSVADALGGVPVCVPEPMHDGRLDLTLPAGRYDVTGEEALAYVSMRLGVGDGSDIGRMKRQQVFLAAMAHKAVSGGTLTNPVRLYSFLDEATKAVAVDEGLASLRKLAGLSRELRDIGLENVEFFTMPIAPYAPDSNRVAIGPGAAQLWQQLRYDEKLSKLQLHEGTSAEGSTYRQHGTTFGVAGGVSAASAVPTGELHGDQYGLCR